MVMGMLVVVLVKSFMRMVMVKHMVRCGDVQRRFVMGVVYGIVRVFWRVWCSVVECMVVTVVREMCVVNVVEGMMARTLREVWCKEWW